MNDNPDAASAGNAQHFPLVITEGEKRFVLQFKDEGVSLNEGGLSWTCDGVARTKANGDIGAIRLRVMPTPGQETGQCTITFDGGETLNVMSWNASGFADAGRAAAYRDFVTALHRRLSPSDRARIVFTSGFAGAGAAWQRIVGNGALVAAALLFVVAPVAVALGTGEQQLYALAIGGAVVLYGLFRKVQRGYKLNQANKPQNYSPDQIPAALLP